MACWRADIVPIGVICYHLLNNTLLTQPWELLEHTSASDVLVDELMEQLRRANRVAKKSTKESSMTNAAWRSRQETERARRR